MCLLVINFHTRLLNPGAEKTFPLYSQMIIQPLNKVTMTHKITLLCRKCSLIAGFLLLCLLSMAQYNFSEVTKKIDDSHKELGKNVVVLIYKGGKVIYKKETEDFKANNQEPVANCSNWLTAALVMTFVDQGKLSLDDKVGQYLPIFNTYGKKFITIRHCLSHMTGIQSEKGFLEKSRFAKLEDEVNDFASKHEIENNPGVEFQYTDLGMKIAGRVLEVIGKRSFDQLMSDRILRPLNMHNTSFFSEKAMNPSGGASSAAIDYINFLSMILNKGMFNGKKILSEKAVEEMLKTNASGKQIKYAPKTEEGYSYGLGAWIQEADDKGNGLVLSAPGSFGTWPIVDNCRGYACIFFIKGSLDEEKKKIYMNIKRSIDEVLPSNCK